MNRRLLDMNKDVQTIINNYDNLEILGIVKYLTQVVIADVENTNDLDNYMTTAYDLGNNNLIRKEDLESLVSIVDTINVIEHDNEKEEK